jgi:amino acid transporter
MSNATAPGGPELRRALGLPLLLFYGLGTIVGAGIYVAIGEVVGRAGSAAPLAFLLAGVLAGLTGLSYAELAARHPEAAGAAAYVQAAFGDARLSRVTGFVTIAVGVLTAASVARGAVGYIQQFAAVPEALGAALVVVLFTAVASLGVRDSVASAAVLTVLEIAGLLAVAGIGLALALSGTVDLAALLPAPGALWPGVPAGAFVAFFAFLGFETLANMAEEARDVGRTLPRAILLSIVLSTLLYVAVVAAAVLAVPGDALGRSAAPLCLVLARAGLPCEPVFSAVALAAIGNGVLIEIMMVARLLYGMARRGWLPHRLGAVTGVTRIPLRATLVAGGAVLLVAVAIGFGALVSLSSALILVVFVAANLALMRLQRRAPRPGLAFRAPRWTPPLAVLASVALIGAALLG